MKKIVCIGLFAIMLCAVGCGSKETSGAGSSGMSKDEYSQITMGITRNEVETIIRGENGLGSVGEEISSSTKDGITTSVYKYPGEKSGYAEITFEYNENDGIKAKEMVTGKKDADIE